MAKRLILGPAEGEYCKYCRREMIDVEEKGGKVWRQCPKYPKSWLIGLFSGPHQSFLRADRRQARIWGS